MGGVAAGVPRELYNPEDCAGLYTWVRDENEAAKRKAPAVRMEVMAIMIAAQKGDCARPEALSGVHPTNASKALTTHNVGTPLGDLAV